MGFQTWGLCLSVAVVACMVSCGVAITEPGDVTAINNLYVSLESPPLAGWIPFGGDPCGENWLGVVCQSSSITELRLSSMNLGGSLSDSFGDFSSIVAMDLSNNHIGGSIPLNLPLSIKNLSLAGNQLNGGIPITITFLTELLELSVSNNLLSGEITDNFHLPGLISLDMSANNFTGPLPSSIVNLTSLQRLYLQNNQLSGSLDVVANLPLQNLNVEDNLFTGPVPPGLFNIPIFRANGNLFSIANTTSPPPSVSPSVAFPPEHGENANGPSSFIKPQNSKKSRHFWKNQTFVLMGVSGAIVLIIVGLCLAYRLCKDKKKFINYPNIYDTNTYDDPPDYGKSSQQPDSKMQKVSREPMMKPIYRYGVDDSDIDMTHVAANHKPLQPPPRSMLKETTKNKHVIPSQVSRVSSSQNCLASVNFFTIASLQEFTDSFSEENFMGEGMLGSVYRAKLPDGKLLAVKKLNSTTSRKQDKDTFFNLVSTLLKIKHDNVLELVGYCDEYNQRLLVYEYCGNGSLFDALHVHAEIHKRLTWNLRIRLALDAAKALQYLHEVCSPPIVHQNFKSCNVLLDDKLSVRISGCGLAPSLFTCSSSQLSGYTAPEIDSESYTCQADVYSLGVVMLELLTRQKPFDRTRPRGEQSLAQWAISQLHDIDALSRMVDPALDGAYPIKSLSRFADIISRCLQFEPRFRPPISEIVQDLMRMI